MSGLLLGEPIGSAREDKAAMEVVMDIDAGVEYFYFGQGVKVA